jgi:hypothetical protein
MTSSAPETAMEEPLPPAASIDEPHFSLLRLSASQRVAGASVVVALLWLAVWWAL